MTLPPLPDACCARVFTGRTSVYTAEQMREYGAACAAAERERCAAIVAQGGAYRSHSEEIGDWAFPEEAIRTGLTP